MIRGRVFFRHEDGSHYETFCNLARDTETGRVYVLTEKSDPGGRWSCHELSIAEFLRDQGSRQSALIELIGTLVDDNAPEIERA
jgi:hypothetical protein